MSSSHAKTIAHDPHPSLTFGFVSHTCMRCYTAHSKLASSQGTRCHLYKVRSLNICIAHCG
ncbi:hypothetical protein K504DRAFT_458687 [Pleomassaria siparia CBS 279.74]|uniref:Uncharacterized protein n=1 Tax=Pleomassaria siparia CBS 279.74 TaxID=1314801 RepID=A0A6G1K4E3_9PLEO|nr:hypothetical protein K504DRAFT_458687 [Pleomassaria siparia CBS 279.74]